MAGVSQRRDGSGRRRTPDCGLLRGQRRALRLAGRMRRALQARVLGRAGLGAAWRPGADVHRRRERLPVQHDRRTRSPRPCPADGRQGRRREERRLHADEAAGRHRDGAGRAGRIRPAGDSAGGASPTVGWLGSSLIGTARRSPYAPAAASCSPSGSFAYNDAMVMQYAPRLAGRPAASIEQHDGQSIRMAQALGADLAHMDATEVAFLIDPQQTVRGILVNARGQRYVAEDMYSGRIGQVTLYHQDDTAYLIIDGDAQEEAMAATSATPFLKRPATWVCDTVAELEGEIGLPARLVAGHGRRRTTRPPRAVRTRCCTRSRNGSSPSAPRSVRSTCGPVALASRSAACRPPWTARCCTSRASRSPGCTRRAAARQAWPRGVTPAASRWVTAVSTADGRAARPRRADALELAPASLRRSSPRRLCGFRRKTRHHPDEFAQSCSTSARRVTAATPLCYKSYMPNRHM